MLSGNGKYWWEIWLQMSDTAIKLITKWNSCFQASCRHRTLPQSFGRGHGWLVSVTASIVCWGLPVRMRWKHGGTTDDVRWVRLPCTTFSISGIINGRVSYCCCSTCNTHVLWNYCLSIMWTLQMLCFLCQYHTQTSFWWTNTNDIT